MFEEISSLNLQLKNFHEEIFEIKERNKKEMENLNLQIQDNETEIEKSLFENENLKKKLGFLKLQLEKKENLNLELELKDKNQQISENEQNRECLQKELIESHKIYKDIIKNQEEKILDLVLNLFFLIVWSKNLLLT